MSSDQPKPGPDPENDDDAPLVPGAIQASDGERDATCAALRDAAGEGRLTFEELADRTEMALTSRTRGELARLTRDLPAAPALPASYEGREIAAPGGSSSFFGDQRRSGIWRVPAKSVWKSVLGDIVLDLRDARIEGSPLMIDVRTVFGDIDVLVPDGVAVDLHVTTVLGTVKQQADATHPDALKVVVTGRTILGDVRVRNKRLRERLAERVLGPRTDVLE